MAVESDLLNRVRAAAALLDDTALAALSNKGLVRRARKDVEQRPPEVVGEYEGRLRVAVEEWTVEVAERPAESRCTCPANGVCRHVLVALMHLATGGSPRAEGTKTFCGGEILSVGDDELRRWAGSGLVKRALAELATGMVIECEDGMPFVARQPTWNVECRWMPGGGLAGMLCSCHAADACVHKVVAVLGWQGQQGVRDIAREETALAESGGAPRTREEVRLSVRQALDEMVAMGLCRLSSASQARLKTLATSAHGVDLPRLERLLQGLADEIGAWLRRDAQASSAGILGRAAQVEALNTALEDPKPPLIGRHRSRYDRVGELDLVGMGARVWRTRSGYAGLTVYFWDRGSGRWNTWTDARPVGTPGFSPVARFTAPGPWSGSESPARAAAGRFRLVGAWRNPAGRLSGRESSRMVVMGPPEAGTDGHEISSWSALVPRAWELFGTGLAEQGELAQVVLLRPQAWSGTVYDQVLQELRVGVVDDDGRRLLLALSHTEENRRAIDTLEAATQTRPPQILGILHLRRGVLAVEPISLIDGTRVVSLGLDGLPTQPVVAAGVSTPAQAEEAGEDDEAEQEELTLGGGPIAELLASTTSELESLAEGGSAAYRGWPRLRALMERSDALGISVVGASLRRLLDGAGSEAGSDRLHTLARGCMRASYVVRLTAATGAVAAATEAYGQ